MQHLFMHFYLDEVRQTGKNHFLSSVIEEAPILKMLDRMEMMGCGAKLLPVDAHGRIDLKALEEAIRAKTSLISISAVCAMTGILQPIQEIIHICHARGVKVHVNATHAIGTWGVSLKEWNVDYLTFDAGAVGGLYSKELIRESYAGNLPPATTYNVMEMARLRAEFEEELIRAIPDCTIFGRDVERVPHIFAVSFPGLMNEALLYLLHRQNIKASIGGGQFQTLTTILKQCGYSEEGAVSFDLREMDDLAHALDVIVTSVRKLRKMSVAL